MMDETIMYRYLSGQATEDEARRLVAWLNSSADNRKEFFELKALWSAQRMMGEKSEADVHTSLNELNRRIDRLQRISFYRRMAAVAALFLLIASGAYFWMSTDRSVLEEELAMVYTNQGGVHTVRTVVLPDSTVVWLGDQATLSCPDKFNGDQRVVTLTGEAFFEVKRDTAHPFIVKTDAYDVQVLGTSFGMNTHASEERAETVLMSGSVQIQQPDGTRLAMLRPGQQALYSKTSQLIEIRAVDVNALTSWRFGLVSLTEVSIQEILQCLENTYGVKIQMNASQIQNRRYNFSFKHSKGVQSALDQLCIITGISAEIYP